MSRVVIRDGGVVIERDRRERAVRLRATAYGLSACVGFVCVARLPAFWFVVTGHFL